eukprot:COSAG02_NODE_3302_length_6981_cov_6.817640_2_plen_124_part_00
MPGLAVAKKSHPRALKPEQQPLPLADDTADDNVSNPANVSDPATQIDPQRLHDYVDGILINADTMLSDLSEYDGYYTVEGDTFKDVCKHTGLDKAQWKAYYRWVHTEFMRGETFLQRNPDHSW